MKEAGESGGSPLHAVRQTLRGLPTEQRLFLTGQLSALILAFLFRYCLPPSHCGPKVRHGIATLLGIGLSTYCFGWLTLFLVGEVVMCYLMLLVIDPRKIQIYTLLITMVYLTFFHVRRYANPLVDELDFTVALMTLTQKLSRFAFEYHDGTVRRDQSLTPTQKHLAIRSPPGILPYLSYTVGFLGLLAGPLCSFNDYQIFIYGEEKKRNPNVAVFKKLWLCCFLLAAHVTLSDQFSISSDPNNSVPNIFLELYLTAACRRPKYYFAWTLADAINNAAGFGYNGISEDGEERWDRLSNLNILRIETATSFKMFIDNWNIQTAVWLKEVCYDRSPFNPLLSTFLLSAAWHGVHAGYYFTFLTAAPITLAARRVRQTIRPWFQHTSWRRLIYSLITWVCTQIAMCYTVAPFILLGLGPSLQLYRSLGFCLHILPLLLLFIVPKRKRPETKGGSSQEPSCDRNYNHLKKEM
ncbi:lysophospholipid acyltransferase 2-like isoform X1 [Bufo bufo]|uniref:lysophospholipid acyltransferase 2-like isoform X1 n=1 Tax=Bufo bufo TaxID=8384 RepID=UPI001ABEB16E|nr:lysophospholipid acyltransferase 2-like isoform X1 [Bufo bufo]